MFDPVQGVRLMLVAGMVGMMGVPALAQGSAGGRATIQPGSTAPVPVRRVNPKRETLAKMMKPVTINFEETRLQDAIEMIRTETGADMEIFWLDASDSVGLDKDKPVTIKAASITALDALERILEKTVGDSGENGWQLGSSGELQIGPKERLNKFKRVELYDISDLLIEVPVYDQVPEIDLQTSLQASQGGGQSPFRDDQQQQTQPGERERRKRELADEVIQLITEIVEPTQWEANGGQAASIRYLQGQIIVSAPDYVHRALGGYPFWPRASTSVAKVEGRRYVTLGVDPSISTVDGFGQSEASAVAGGQIIQSGPGGR